MQKWKPWSPGYVCFPCIYEIFSFGMNKKMDGRGTF